MLSRLARLFRRSEMVGKDQAGNFYYRKNETAGRALVEKRWVEFKDGPDPTSIPVEWTSWLAGTRKIAPTQQDMYELEEQRRTTKLKATLLEKEDEKRRFRAKSLQHTAPDISSPESMERLFQQIANPDPEAGDQSPLSKVAANQNADSVENTESPSRSSEPVGQGDAFMPGTWKPS